MFELLISNSCVSIYHSNVGSDLYLSAVMCLFGIFHLTREFANHLDMKLLPMNGCKF